MSKLLNSQGEPIKKEVDESKLPTVDQILKDPITKKFLFLESVDYPDHIHPVASQVENNEVDFGIIICGSGNGANMTANKHQKIRSALCWSKEIATLSRTHNNANILSIPSRFVSLNEAKEMVNSFLNTSFEGGRHETRVNKIPK